MSLCLFVSCKEEIIEEDKVVKPTISKIEKPKISKEKPGNPYIVANMKKAYIALSEEQNKIYHTSQRNKVKKTKANSILDVDVLIEASHKYVKFTPKSLEELNELKKDTTIVLYKYPLDDDFTDEELENHTSQLDVIIEEKENEVKIEDDEIFVIIDYYAALPKDHQINETLHYEVLEDLFIPDEDKIIEGEISGSQLDPFSTLTPKVNIPKVLNFSPEALTKKSFELTNNVYEEKDEVKVQGIQGILRSKWRPSGRITVVDDVLGEIGVEGVKVRATRWFTTHTGFVNKEGYFSCNGRFRGSARYRMDWERHDFALRKGGFSSAEKKGPKGRKKYWNWKITGGEDKYYATIFRAAFHYYYKDIKGLRRPKQNTFWNAQLRIGAFTRGSSSLGVHQSGSHFGGLVTGIKVYRYGSSDDETYATTIHELAHSAHYEMDKYNFRHTDAKVKESWARGVQWVLTSMVYSGYGGGDIKRPNYTQVVVDMIDTPSDSNNGIETLQDNVSGYTIRQIEDALLYGRNWDSWKNNILNKYNNETENNIHTLFDYWN